MIIYTLFTHPFNTMIFIPLMFGSMTIVGGCMFVKISKSLDKLGY